jgi:hypothetical protein
MSRDGMYDLGDQEDLSWMRESKKGKTMKVVIGLAGVKTSGKSTAADIIKDIIGNNVTESALADKLKDVSGEVFGIPRDDFDNQDVKEVPFTDGPKILRLNEILDILTLFNTGLTPELLKKYTESGTINLELETPRRIAQVVGTEVLRATGKEDIHCENMVMNESGTTVVSDLRFPNEYAYFDRHKDIAFIPLYIQRDEAEKHVTEDSHPSEKCVFEFSDKCRKINNNGSLEDLKTEIETVLAGYGIITSLSQRA